MRNYEVMVILDPGLEEQHDVLVALLALGAWCVRVCQLVDEADGRAALECSFDVELLDDDAPVLDTLAREDFEPFELLDGRPASVRLREADNDVLAVRAGYPAISQVPPDL